MSESEKRKAIIFGLGSFGEVVDFYLTHDSNYEVVAFTETEPEESEHLNRPVVPFDEISIRFPSNECHMFIAVGYAQMNILRERFMNEARSKGYHLLSYICSKTTHWGDTEIGENVFIFEDNTIQPFITIGEGTILWSGNHIGHHSKIGPYCFITSHVVVSGHCNIGSHCFIGVNATISDGISIGDRTLIGSAALIQKNTKTGTVFVSERAKKLPADSKGFFK